MGDGEHTGGARYTRRLALARAPSAAMRVPAPTGPAGPRGAFVLLGSLALLLAFATLQVGSGVGVTFSAASVLQGLRAALGSGAPLAGALQALFEQRVVDTTAVALVGAALALSGG